MTTKTTKPTKTAKAPAATSAQAKSSVPRQRTAVADATELSEDVLKSVEKGQRAAIDAVRRFVTAVDEALPAIGERPSRRQNVIDAALAMADSLVTTQYDFLRHVVRDAGRTLDKPDEGDK